MTIRKFSHKEVVDSRNKNLLTSILSEIPKKITPKQQVTVELQKKVKDLKKLVKQFPSLGISLESLDAVSKDNA